MWEAKLVKFYREFIFSFYNFGVISSGAQSLLLALSSEIIPCNLEGLYGMQGIKTGQPHVKKMPSCYTIAPAQVGLVLFTFKYEFCSGLVVNGFSAVEKKSFNPHFKLFFIILNCWIWPNVFYVSINMMCFFIFLLWILYIMLIYMNLLKTIFATLGGTLFVTIHIFDALLSSVW